MARRSETYSYCIIAELSSETDDPAVGGMIPNQGRISSLICVIRLMRNKIHSQSCSKTSDISSAVKRSSPSARTGADYMEGSSATSKGEGKGSTVGVKGSSSANAWEGTESTDGAEGSSSASSTSSGEVAESTVGSERSSAACSGSLGRGGTASPAVGNR